MTFKKALIERASWAFSSVAIWARFGADKPTQVSNHGNGDSAKTSLELLNDSAETSNFKPPKA